MHQTKLKKSIRTTSQQRVILDYLKSVKNHPSAEIIYNEIKNKLPQISMGTVYRNLGVLKNKGDILELTLKTNSRYDGDTSLHSHFICEKCGKIFDIFSKSINSLNFKNRKLKFGEIKSHQLYLYGFCDTCKKKK